MSTSVSVQVSIKPKTVFRKIPDEVVTKLNGCFPGLGSQLSGVLELATEYQKQSTSANEAKYQSQVTSLVQDLLVKGIGRSVLSNGLLTSVPCAETEGSSKPDSSSQKRKLLQTNSTTVEASEGDLSRPGKTSKKAKALESSLLSSGDKPKVSKPQAAFVPPGNPALELLKRLYPKMIPNIQKHSAKLFTAAMNQLLEYKTFKKYKINVHGWDLFLACVDQDDPEVVHAKFFEDERIKFDKTNFKTWFGEVKSSVEKITKFSLKSAIRTTALEKMTEYFPESEDDCASEVAELDFVGDELLEDEVKETKIVRILLNIVFRTYSH